MQNGLPGPPNLGELPAPAQLLGLHLRSCDQCRLWNVADGILTVYAKAFDHARDCLICLGSDGQHVLQFFGDLDEKIFVHCCSSARESYRDARGALRKAFRGKYGATDRAKKEHWDRAQQQRKTALVDAVGWLDALNDLPPRHQ